jgi:dTDP-glucose 4,6-dehydratase
LANLRLLVTGGAGFIGSNLVRFLLRERPDVEIVNLDLLTYAGDMANLGEVREDPRHTFVHGDICNGPLVRNLLEGGEVVLNLAAESHVDRSIQRPAPFVQTNIVGTRVLLDASLVAGVSRFVQVSTDEVYGELPWADPEAADPHRSSFSEGTPLQPRSPYSASKAAADLLVLSYHTTFGMDVVIPRGSNNYGPNQDLEKLIPLMATRAIRGEPLPVYGDGLHVRDWIFVEDFCSGILAALEKGRSGGIYNLGGNNERTNLQVVRAILRALDRPEDLITFVPDRPGHDRRYAMDCSKARRELGWEPRADFEAELVQIVEGYRAHPETCGCP